MQTDGADVIIVGAGVIGCAIAYFLSKEGIKVVVVEKDGLGDHASPVPHQAFLAPSY